MTNTIPPIDILSGPERRRRWTAAEKVAIVNETYEPGVTVSLVARRHGIAPNQLFHWRKLAAQGALTAAGRGEEVVPASDYRALQNQVSELQRFLGKKTLEAEVLKEALEVVDSKHGCCGPSRCRRTVPDECRGRPPLPDAALVKEIKAVIATMPTYGYRRVHAALARRAHEQDRAPPNHKRVYRVMKVHGLLLQ